MAQQEEAKYASPEDFKFYKQGHWNITNNVAKSANGSHGSAIGEKAITEGVHQWLIQYETTKRCCGQIGICPTTDGQILSSDVYTVPGTVCWHHSGTNACTGYHHFGSKQTIKSGLKVLNSGDKIRIILDLKQKKVSFYHNGEFAFEKTNIPTDKAYRVCVDGDGTADKYTILESQDEHPNVSLKPLLSAISTLSKTLSSFDMTTLHKLSIQDLTLLKQDVVKFADERKEFEQTFEEYTQQVKKFGDAIEKVMNPDTKNYKDWNADQICRYIISLENQRFAKYMDEFRKAIESQEICGGDLPEISANDILTMGVTKFKDRKALAKYFEALGCSEGTVTENH